MMRIKTGWTAIGIVGAIFAPIGLLFSVLGIVLGRVKSASWKSPKDLVIFLAVFGGIGGLFLILGLVFLGLELRRKRRLERAYYSGKCVQAQILGVVTQNNVNTFQGQPRMVECAWTDDAGVAHIYRSRYLYTNVEKLLKSDTVPVYIDRDDENIGFVDIDAVLPEIRIH